MTDRRDAVLDELALDAFWTGVVEKAGGLDGLAAALSAGQREPLAAEHDEISALAEAIAWSEEFWAGVAHKRRLLEAPVVPHPAADEFALVAALYDEYGPALYRYCYKFLQDRGRAEDAVQEVLIKAWRRPERLDPSKGSVQGWLFTVARNVLTDQWRAEQARERAAAKEAVPVDDDAFDRLVEGWQVEEALGELSTEQREVLYEVYYRGRTVADTARVLGIPPGTVKSRTHYALRALKAALERKRHAE